MFVSGLLLLSQPVHATPTDQAGLWGAPSYCTYTDDGTYVDMEFRMVMGELIDEDFDAGQGYQCITLPKPALLNASNPGNGWLFGAASDFSLFAKDSTQLFVDPPLASASLMIISPDGVTSWNSRNPEDDPPPGYVIDPDYPVPTGALYVVGGTIRYRKA